MGVEIIGPSPLLPGSAPAATRWRSGQYYTSPAVSAAATAAPTQNTMRAHPLDVPHDVTVDRIAVEVTGAGGAGSVVRLGIYLDDGTGVPGALLLDAGAGIDGTSATGQAITISQALSRGRLWLACVSQVGTVPTMRALAGGVAGVDLGTTIATNVAVGYQSGTSTSGALPASFGTPTGGVVVPKIMVRVV